MRGSPTYRRGRAARFLALLAGNLSICAGSLAQGEQSPRVRVFPAEKLAVGANSRECRLVAPKSLDVMRPAPLVFALHGFLIDRKDAMPFYSKLNETAEKHGFILVYPNVLDRSWALTPGKTAKDLALFDALLKKLSADYRIDSERIYVTGMSNGGYFAHLMAKERCRVVAAAACHSGALGLQTLLGIRAERKFPVMIIHGDRDGIISVNIARENRDKYRKEGRQVEYVEIPGQPHWWAASAGINDRIWRFFSEHPPGGK